MYEEERLLPESGAEEQRERGGAPPAGDGEGGVAARGDGGGRGATPRRRARSRRTVSPEDAQAPRSFTPEQRLLMLDVWQRSDLSASDFSELAGVSPHSLYTWRKSPSRSS